MSNGWVWIYLIFLVLGILEVLVERERLKEEFRVEENFSLHVGIIVLVFSLGAFLIGFSKVGGYIVYGGILYYLYNLMWEMMLRIKRWVG
ncbi:MAG: hypothetical protein QW607_09875 [Desulfurococcaceae archaeon]